MTLQAYDLHRHIVTIIDTIQYEMETFENISFSSVTLLQYLSAPMNPKTRLIHINKFLAQQPILFAPKSFSAEQRLSQTDAEVAQLINRRIEQETFIRKQQQNQLAIERYFVAKEDAYAKAARKILIEEQYAEMQRAEINKCRENSRQVIQMQKDTLVKQFAEKMKKQELDKQQNLARQIETHIKQENVEKDRLLQDLQIPKELMAQLLMVQTKPPPEQKFAIDRKITFPDVEICEIEGKMDEDALDAIRFTVNYCMTQGINKGNE
ncbi:Hypothetical_protein [Hexamita inflata]|nr:Hypothetical protein HINF_LOCUS47408 [Hexamita inflata]